YRVACRARCRPGVQVNASVPVEDLAREGEPQEACERRELRKVIDEELALLPARYRRALILCCLEGKTQEEAARLLGWPKGTVATRVNRGRDRLRLRLERRGLTLTSGVLATTLTESAGAAPLAAELVRNALQGALAFAAGKPI